MVCKSNQRVLSVACNATVVVRRISNGRWGWCVLVQRQVKPYAGSITAQEGCMDKKVYACKYASFIFIFFFHPSSDLSHPNGLC
jgi:hypothetical protein